MFELIDFLIVNPIINILFVVYNCIGDFGLAVIIFTVVIKLATWPLVKKQYHQTKLMKKIQPELVEIRKRANGNKQLESLEMMNLYKKHNIKPMASIWSLLIQLPIFFALFFAVRVMVLPSTSDNVEKRAYPVVAKLERIDEVINLQKSFLENTGEKSYDFKPQLFGTIDLSTRADLKTKSGLFVMALVLLVAMTSYYMANMQIARSGKKKQSTWKKMMEDAKAGKDPDQADINDMVSKQMSFMMPLMMLFFTMNLPGALVLYYFLSNLISVIQQKIVFAHVDDEMDDNTDRAILRELKSANKKLQEAEIIENKKTGTKITRIKARDSKPQNKQKHQNSSLDSKS